MSIIFNLLTVTLRPVNLILIWWEVLTHPEKDYMQPWIYRKIRGSHQGTWRQCPPQHCSSGVSLLGYQSMMILCQSSNQHQFTKSTNLISILITMPWLSDLFYNYSLSGTWQIPPSFLQLSNILAFLGL